MYDLQKLATQIGIRVAFPRIINLAWYLAATQWMRSFAKNFIRRYE
jgi:hypothetical protein